MTEAAKKEKVLQVLPLTAPDGKPWREDALHVLGAHLVRWHSPMSGPQVEPDIDVSGYADAVRQADANGSGALASKLRAERNARLAASDWTQLPDVALSKERAAAWKSYRQALRDLPASSDLATVEWPTPPEK